MGSVFKRTVHCELVSPYDSTKCLECHNGYKVDVTSGKCVKGVETCKFYYSYRVMTNGVETVELKCGAGIDGYANGPSGLNDCSATNVYCDTLFDNDCSKCVQCAPGTQLNANGVCELIDKHCANGAVVDGVYQCTQCGHGYYLDGNKKCQAGTIEGCAEYESQTVCKRCMNGGHVEGGKCVSGCGVSNCGVCKGSDTSKCLACEDGFYLSSDQTTCSACDSSCAVCGTSATECLACKDSTKIVSNGKCVSRIRGCKEYVKDGECSTCEDGYILGDDKKCQTTDGCLTKDTSGTCTSCVEGYYSSSSNVCKQCDLDVASTCIHSSQTPKENDDEHCYKTRADGKCGKCEEEYGYIVKDGECVLSGSTGCDLLMMDGTCSMCGKEPLANGVYKQLYNANENGTCPKPETGDPETDGKVDYDDGEGGDDDNDDNNGCSSLLIMMITFVFFLF